LIARREGAIAGAMLLDRLGMTCPIIQAPMAGTSTPALAAAVSQAGGLGSIALGAAGVDAGRAAIHAVRARTRRAFQVNLFCHTPAIADPAVEAAWIAALAPHFAALGADPPVALDEIYRSFLVDDAMLAMLVAERPAAISFHFGLPSPDRIAALRATGAVLMATATNPREAAAIAAAGIDIVVAQGIEAGGHRGDFDPAADDDALSVVALVGQLARGPLPVVAAGGIMTGGGVAAMLALGAVAAQLGTAFIACPESDADPAYRAALASEAAQHTVMTAAISGRRARCVANAFTRLGAEVGDAAAVPAYPRAYAAGKALNAAAKRAGRGDYGAQWAGQGAPLSRPMPAADLVRLLASECAAATKTWAGSSA